MLIRCLKCKEPSNQDTNMPINTCPSCGFSTKSVYGIPLYVENLEDYVSKKILFCENSIRNLNNTKRILKDNISERVNNSILFQTEILKDIQIILSKECDILSVLENMGKDQHLGYGVSIEYLIRDWSFLSNTEKEILKLKKAIVPKIAGAKKRVLVLGAGLGRLAIELLDTFEEVYAIDLSFEMPYLFNKILVDKNIEFDYFFTKNIPNEKSQFLNLKINSMYLESKLSSKLGTNQFNYFVADVTNLPFIDEYFDTIISCYFTDVLPLELILPEITRTLKSKGSFIHFGPLDYHFNDVSKMLTLEDVFKYFKDSNFDIVNSKPVPMEHISLPARFKKKIYVNQLFSAIKKNSLSPKKVSLKKVLKISNPISFLSQGTLLHNQNVIYNSVDFTTSDGQTYEGALGVFEVLRRIDGKKNMSVIFRELSDSYDFDKAYINKISEILYDLVGKGYLQQVEQ